MAGSSTPVSLCPLTRVEVHDGSTRKSFDASSQGSPLLLSIEAQQDSSVVNSLILLIHAGFQRLLSVRLSDLLKPNVFNREIVSCDANELRLSVQIPSQGQILVVYFGEVRDHTMTVFTLQKSGFSIQNDNAGAFVNSDGHQGVPRATSRPRLSSITPIYHPEESQQAASLASTQSAVSFEDTLRGTAWPSYDHGGMSMSQPLLSSCSSSSPFNEQSPASSIGSLLGDAPKLPPAHHAGMAGIMAHSPVAYRPRVSSPLRYCVQPVELQRSWSNPAMVSPYQFPIPAQPVGGHEPYSRPDLEPVAKPSVPVTSQPRSQRPSSVSKTAASGENGDANESEDFEPGAKALRDLLPAPRRLPFSTTTNGVCLDRDYANPHSGRKRKAPAGNECSDIQGKAKKTKVKSPKGVEGTTARSRKATREASRNVKSATETAQKPQTKANEPSQSGTVPFLMLTRSRQREVKLPVTEPATLPDKPSSVGPSRSPKLAGKKVGRVPKKKQGPVSKASVQTTTQTKGKRPPRVQEKEGMPESEETATRKQRGKQKKELLQPIVDMSRAPQKHRKANTNKTHGNPTPSSCRSGPSKAIEPAKTKLEISSARTRSITAKPSADLLPPKRTNVSLKGSARAKTGKQPNKGPVESESRSGNYESRHDKSIWTMRPAALEMPKALLKANNGLCDSAKLPQALMKKAGRSPGSLPPRKPAASTTKSTSHIVNPSNSHMTPTHLDISSPNHDSKSDSRIPRSSSSACTNCRKVHRRCDKKPSTCGRCQLYGLKCVFEAGEGQSSQQSPSGTEASTTAKDPRLITQVADQTADKRECRTLRSRAKSVKSTDLLSTDVGHEGSILLTPSLPQQNLVPIVYDTTGMQQLEALTDPFFQQYEADIARGCDAEISANFYLHLIHGARTTFWSHLLEGHSPSSLRLMEV